MSPPTASASAPAWARCCSAAGAKGKRNALPHSRIMIHQPLAGMEGTATDILIHAEEFIRMKKQLNQIYQKHSGQTLERLQDDTDRDRFMSPEEARDYGLIDQVVDREPAIPAEPEPDSLIGAVGSGECIGAAAGGTTRLRASVALARKFARRRPRWPRGSEARQARRAGTQQKPVSAAGSAACRRACSRENEAPPSRGDIGGASCTCACPPRRCRPVSSRHSRSTAWRGSSPGSHLPPGNSQYPA